jgi:hypothetical protein
VKLVGPGQPAKRLSLAAMVRAAACPSFSTAAFAGSARDYLNAPVDAWLVMSNAGYVTSVTPEDGTDISSRTVSNAFLQSVVLTRTMDFWGRAGGLSIVLPYAVANTSSSAFQGSTNGVSDVALLWQINIFGGPARAIPLVCPADIFELPSLHRNAARHLQSDFADQSEREPLDGLADINYSHTLDRGWTWIETYFTAQFFTNNNNFFVNGARTLAQNPIFRMEEHISRNLTDRFWLSADAYYNVGGETSIDGTPQDNAASKLRVGAGMGLRLWRGADLGLNCERVVARPAGEPDSQTIRLSLRQFW